MSFVDRGVLVERAKCASWPGQESVVTYPVPAGPSSILIEHDVGGTRALLVREMEQTTAFDKDGMVYIAQLTGADDWDAALAAMAETPPDAGWIATDLWFDVDSPRSCCFRRRSRGARSTTPRCATSWRRSALDSRSGSRSGRAGIA